jgi:diacylglycerol kinase family enzyme
LSGIGILVNPHAGAVRRDPELPDRMRRTLGGNGEVCVAGSVEEVPALLERFRGAGVEVLGVVGGDGSNLYALTAATQVFGSALPPIAMLKGGSINTVGRAMGLRGGPEDLLERLVHARQNGGVSTLDLPTMRVNGFVGFVFGAGLVANFYDTFYQGKGKRLPDVIALVAKCFWAALSSNELSRRLFAPVPMEIRVDGEPIEPRQCTLVLASTIDNQLGFRVTYRAREEPGRFHIVASENHHRKLARQFYRAFLGKPLTGPRHHDGLASEVVIQFDAPRRFMVDGDIFEAERVAISPGPVLPLIPL